MEEESQMRRPFLILLFITAMYARGTTIAVLWTPTGAIVGADAKVKSGTGESGGQACKIGVADNSIWAQSGIVWIRNSKLDFRSILASEFSTPGPIDSKITRLERRISVELTSLLNGPLIKNEVLANPEPHQVQFVVVTREGGVVRMLIRSFMPKRGSAGQVEITIVRDGCPGPGCNSTQYVGLGFHKEADEALKSDQSIWMKPPVDFVKYVINMGITYHPSDVGLPAGIAFLNDTGVHWVERGACADK